MFDWEKKIDHIKIDIPNSAQSYTSEKYKIGEQTTSIYVESAKKIFFKTPQILLNI